MRWIIGLLLLGLLLPQGALAVTSTSTATTTRKIVTFRSQQHHSTVVVEQLGDVVHEFQDEPVVAAELSVDAAEVLAKRADVVSVVDDPIVTVAARAQEVPWGVTRMGADRVRALTAGAGSIVAIVDTGIDLDHPDLIGAVRSSVNLVSPGRTADDDNGHGTHVAGIVAARDNAVGVVGVAPASSLLIAKALDRRGSGYLSDIVAGITWAANNGAQVINLSLGTSVDLPLLHDAVRDATNRGITVVAAAGNSGGPVLYPAAYSEVIAVGMTDDRDRIHRASSRGSALDLVAPGDDIYSTYKGDRYRKMTGTSMAAPHVAGAVALLLAQPARCDSTGDGRCNAVEVQATLQSKTTDLLAPGWDSTSGAGLVNVARLFGL